MAKTRFLGHYGGAGNTQPPDNSVFSYYVAPGLSLQLPYCTIEARLQGTHYGTSAAYPNAPVQGWQWQPTLNLQFDLLADIFQPRLVDVAHVSGYAPRSTWSSSGSVATRTTTYQSTTVDLVHDRRGPVHGPGAALHLVGQPNLARPHPARRPGLERPRRHAAPSTCMGRRGPAPAWPRPSKPWPPRKTPCPRSAR